MQKVEYELKTGPQGHIYLPKRIRETFGNTLKFLPNSNAAVIYPKNMEPGAVIKSLYLIISDLKLREEQNNRGAHAK